MNRRFFLALVLCVPALLSSPAFLQAAAYPPKYMAAGVPDVAALLSPPPTEGTPEAAADLATTRQISQGRTEAQVAAAKEEIELSPFRFSLVLGPWFLAEKLPQTARLFGRVQSDVYAATSVIKKHYKRARPYVTDPSIRPLEPEDSFSYPSGHSTRATVFALIIAEVFPDKRTELVALSRSIGWNRVIAGVHYHTDIVAGRVLGQAVARELLKNAEFCKELEAAKAEILAAIPAKETVRP